MVDNMCNMYLFFLTTAHNHVTKGKFHRRLPALPIVLFIFTIINIIIVNNNNIIIIYCLTYGSHTILQRLFIMFGTFPVLFSHMFHNLYIYLEIFKICVPFLGCLLYYVVNCEQILHKFIYFVL